MAESKNIYEELQGIQTELKVAKEQNNNFGGYKYRSCEDILEAVKPLLVKNKLLLVLHDELVNIGERYYIKATADLLEIEGTGKISNIAFAREEETKKGMDGSQITGASSSYARKYALNGLLLIDDTKDSDHTYDGKEEKKPTTATAEADLGDCKNCGSPNKLSKAGKPYCSALCWKNPDKLPIKEEAEEPEEDQDAELDKLFNGEL